jgi:hypothetical protein
VLIAGRYEQIRRHRVQSGGRSDRLSKFQALLAKMTNCAQAAMGPVREKSYVFVPVMLTILSNIEGRENGDSLGVEPDLRRSTPGTKNQAFLVLSRTFVELLERHSGRVGNARESRNPGIDKENLDSRVRANDDENPNAKNQI